MKILAVILSPREKGTSTMMAKYLKERLERKNHTVEIVPLYPYLNRMDVLLAKITACDTIVMIGASYVTSYPAPTILLLEQMAATKGVLHGQSLYGFIQGGMPYIHTHESGLRLLKIFAEKEKVTYKGGFVMGGGAMLDGRSLSHCINAKVIVPAVNEFIRKIGKNQAVERQLYVNTQLKIPGVVARGLAIMLTHMVKKGYKKKGINYKIESPYKKTAAAVKE